MKQIPLTKGRWAIIDDEDFEKVSQYKWWCHSKGYAEGYIGNYKRAMMHKFIMNVEGKLQVDHINHDKLDNRRENLRIATHSQNMYNSQTQKNSTSRLKGVRFLKGKRLKHWQSYICPQYKFKSLGYFLTKEEAAKAYNEAAGKLYKEFAYLNKI